MEKQIEEQVIMEMADDVRRIRESYFGQADYLFAKKLFEDGYRKQSKNVIELPCKVGDMMYVKYKGIAYPVKVNGIRIDTKKNNHRICVFGTFHLYEYYDHNYKATFPFDSIGKSLFYTEAEAMKGGE